MKALRKNKDSLIQPIQRGVAGDYSNAYDDVVLLEKKGYVQKGKIVLSQRNKPGQGHRLSGAGVNYVMGYSQDRVLMLKTLENYEAELPGFDVCLQILVFLSEASPGSAVRVMNNAGQGMLLYGSNYFNDDVLAQTVLGTALQMSMANMRNMKKMINAIPELKAAALSSINAQKKFLEEDSE